MKEICRQFPLSNDEWLQLEAKFENLAFYASWQLLKMNTKNNHTDEIEDIAQELRWSIYLAGCYTKRQVYIESCLQAASTYVKDPVVAKVVAELANLWANRTRHGANKVKYGDHQQQLLEMIIQNHVPEHDRPDKSRPLVVDAKFITYCKTITWNHKKSLGKKITREKSWRTGLVSLSTFDHLGNVG